MPQRWYEKTSVQAAMVSGVALVLVALVGLHRPDEMDRSLQDHPPRVQPEASHGFKKDMDISYGAGGQVDMAGKEIYSAAGFGERVRLRNDLHLLTVAESGLSPEKVPLGTYAFSHPSVLEYGASPMFRVPEYGRLSYEVQKSASGQVLALVFVNADEYPKLALSSRISAAATLYSDFWEDAKYATLVDVATCHGKSRFITLDDGSKITAVDCEPDISKKHPHIP